MLAQMDQAVAGAVAPNSRAFIVKKFDQQPIIGVDSQPSVGFQFELGYTTNVQNPSLLSTPQYGAIADMKPAQ